MAQDRRPLCAPEQVAARALQALDPLALECDGICRCLSALLQRQHVEHGVQVGRLDVEGVGAISMHWWVELSGGYVCDARARMWLGTDERVPHGVFRPSSVQRYTASEQRVLPVSLTVFLVLTGSPIEAFLP